MIDHSPDTLNEEIKRMIVMDKNKGAKVNILKYAFVETIYEAWKYRNDRCFENENNKNFIGDKIIDNIVFRCWVKQSAGKYWIVLCCLRDFFLVFLVSLLS